jgi:hypothetical protein
VRLIRISVLAVALCFATIAYGKQTQPTVQETVSKATVALYAGKQVCQWNQDAVGFFGEPEWAWGCKFVSKVLCTATVIDADGHDYIALTAGHCILPEIREANAYYISDIVEDEPVLRHAKILKAENDDRYDYALIEFTSNKDYPVVSLNGEEDTVPAIGTELLNVNFSYGLGKQVVHGVVTSGLVNVEDLKKRYLTTLQTGPGASGSAIVDAKTGKIVGVLELGFPRSAMGAGAIPTGKNLANFIEDESAGLAEKPAVGEPPQPPVQSAPTIWEEVEDIFFRLLDKLKFWS